MQKYPYLAQYNGSSQNEDIVLYMLEPHRGVIVYIPPDLTPGDIRLELSVMETMTPANSDIEDYAGSVVFRNSADPILGS